MAKRRVDVSISEIKSSFSHFVNRVAYGNDWIVITSHGQPKVAVIDIDDLGQLMQSDDYRFHQVAGQPHPTVDPAG